MACDTPISENMKNIFVISACGFTWQGYDELLMQGGLRSTRIEVKDEDASRGEINTLFCRPGK